MPTNGAQPEAGPIINPAHALLRKYRRARMMKQKVLAEAADVPQQALSRYEKGIAVPDASRRARIATVLGTSAEVLWPEEECPGLPVKADDEPG